MKIYKKKVHRREMEILNFLNNKNICPKMLKIDQQFVTFEFYDFTLSDILFEKEKYSGIYGKIKTKLSQLLSSLHSYGIIHGDLHPSNIMINFLDSENINDFDLKIIDFGLSFFIKDLNEKNIKIYDSLYMTHTKNKNIKNIFEFKKFEFELVNSFFQ